MINLKIRAYMIGETALRTTVTVPGAVLKIASRLIPRQAIEILQEKGIDLNEIVQLFNNPDVCGTLVEVEYHVKNEIIVIALE